MIRLAILTVSDRCLGGQEDLSTPALREKLEASGIEFHEEHCEVLPDNADVLRRKLMELAPRCDLILTTGSTGLSPTDVAPEATRSVMSREIPGIAEAMRDRARAKSPNAVLSRCMGAVVERSLVINLPGGPERAVDALDAVLHVLEEAVGTISDVGWANNS